MSVDEALQRLRTADPPIIARASRDRVLLDVRTVAEEELVPLADALASCAGAP
jgi:seryl-tRNA(Sec) selenium transferase